MKDGDVLCPLSRWSATTPEGVCALQGSRTFSFQQMDALAGGVQDWCAQEGIQVGDRLAVCLPPDPLWIPLLFGCLRAGVLLTPLNLRLPENVLQKQAASVGATKVLNAFPAFEPRQHVSPTLDPELPATLVFTSGSTGEAKGRVHTLRQHLRSAESSRERDGIEPGDTWLLSLPLFHVGGLAILFRCGIAGAAVHVPGVGESPEARLLQGGISHASFVPTQLYRLLKQAPEKPTPLGVKRILIGGAAAGRELLSRAFSGGWPVASSYGSTETASQMISVPQGVSPEAAQFSSGICLPHASVQRSAEGELWVKSDSLCLGTWEQGGMVPLVEKGGWYATGDACRISAEGWIQIEGRMDRMMISGGENVHPERIEATLCRVSGREQVVVVPVPDEEFGQRPGAWVEGKVTPEDVRNWSRHLREHLPGYMIPVEYRSLPDLTGLKPDVAALTRLWAERI